MKRAHLIVVVGCGLIAVTLSVLSLRRESLGKAGLPDYDQPLSGRAPVVTSADLVSAPDQYHRRRIVLDGIWRRDFEVSALELVEDQGFGIWVSIWDSQEFAAESKEHFERVSSEMVFGVPTALRLRAEGSFYYRRKESGGGFGHLGGAEALFLIDRILRLERIESAEPKIQDEPGREGRD